MQRMPVLFVGHGSPMNAIEDNPFTRGWEDLAGQIPKPEAILSVSAHWTTRGTKTSDAPAPRQIYDMYGFPPELYELHYEPAGAPDRARQVQRLVPEVAIDNGWGIDHGTWSVLCRMYPAQDRPVFQLSLARGVPAQQHFELGQKLRSLREQGVLILGSGNIVHNLGRVSWSLDGGFDWALEFDQYIETGIMERHFDAVIDYSRAGEIAQRAFNTTEHFDPLLYVLGATDETDSITVFNKACTLGSISMTSYLFE